MLRRHRDPKRLARHVCKDKKGGSAEAPPPSKPPGLKTRPASAAYSPSDIG